MTKTKATKAAGSKKNSQPEDSFITIAPGSKSFLKNVQDQYLDYPYPLRNPEEEKTRLLKTQGEFLGEMSHYLYNGKEDFKSGFRVLIAGGGTGDASTYLGEQLKHTDAEIVYLDFSKTSMEIAQARAKIRGLKNITWINDSLLNIPNLGLGKFNYINCSGVLHHLESPELGLKTLSDALTENGAMTLMVYALYGRTGVYQIQSLMKLINAGVDNRKKEVLNGWTVINSLPKTNWYERGKDLLADHLGHGDAGMYDMFLHKQDRAYTIPQLYEYVKSAGLNIIEFSDPYTRACLNIDTYVQDIDLNKRIKSMDIISQQAICELFCGNIIKHVPFVSKQKDTIAKVSDLDNIPYFFYLKAVGKQIYDSIEQNPQYYGQLIQFTLEGFGQRSMTVKLPVLPYTKYIYKYIDEKRTFNEIFAAIREELGSDISDELLLDQTTRSISPLMQIDLLFLRHKSVAPFNEVNV